jgi:hypothetical protein
VVVVPAFCFYRMKCRHNESSNTPLFIYKILGKWKFKSKSDEGVSFEWNYIVAHMRHILSQDFDDCAADMHEIPLTVEVLLHVATTSLAFLFFP